MRSLTVGVFASLAFAALGAVACSGSSQAPVERPISGAQAGSAKGIGGGRSERQARIAQNEGNGLDFGERNRCGRGMVSVENRFCIDRFEASVVEVLPSGDERPWSPFEAVTGRTVRAVSQAHVYPQGYISAVEAERACRGSGKRLCRVNEWRKACMGPKKAAFGYGNQSEPGRCNDSGRNPVIATFGRGQWNWEKMNQPILNQLDGTLAKTADHEGCTNDYGVYDMVGNLHEWVADPEGTFYGGYYQDVTSHGEGCSYLTTAHEARYHDYSTGFRCCADLAGR